MFLTPRADAQYMDSFSSNVRTLSPTSFSVTTGRLDREDSPPWGQQVTADFLAIDSSLPFLSGFQLGSVYVGSSSSSFKVVQADFPKPFSESPRLLVTARASQDVDQLFVASIISVSPTVKNRE